MVIMGLYDFNGYCNGPCGLKLVVGHLILVACLNQYILIKYVSKHTTENHFLLLKVDVCNGICSGNH